MYTVYVPERFRGRTGYQIFVDRFNRVGEPPIPMDGRKLKKFRDFIPDWQPDSDGIYRNQYFYGGNIKGITEKIPYFKRLNVNLLYLSPISFTRSSHHYDVEDQRVIDPWIGTEEDLRELCRAAHENDILVCVDLVFNHMGSNSKFVKDTVENPNSRYRSWFEWDKNGNPVYWFGFKDMRQCNKYNPEYQDFCFSACKFYIDCGVDGFRLDLGEILPAEFLRNLRTRIRDLNPEILIVSETWGFATRRDNVQINGDQVDSVMNYPILDAIIRWVRFGNTEHLKYTWKELSQYPSQVRHVLWNFLDSHDTPRSINMLAAEGIEADPYKCHVWDIEEPWRFQNGFDTYAFRAWEEKMDSKFDIYNGVAKLKLASLLQYFEEGIPIVYYGSETCTTGYKDPFNRKPFYGEPHPMYDEYSLRTWNTLFVHYCKLGEFRKMNRDVLASGETIEYKVTPESLLKVRLHESSALILVMNRTDKKVQNPIKDWDTNHWKTVYFDGGVCSKEFLAPYSAIVYRADNF